MDAKHILASKTIWFNAIIGTVMLTIPDIVTVLDDFIVLGVAEEATAKIRAYLNITLVVGNILLRKVTTKPVRLT